MIPPKLKPGDEIRVIAPSRSLKLINDFTKNLAIKRLEDLGFKVSFGKHVLECDEFLSSSVESRLEDLHDAFKDKNVKGILTVLGGFKVNQLLEKIDYELIKNNPKVLCGYSDITALQNAIYAKTNLVTYSGPHFSTFGMEIGAEYIIEGFKKCLMQEAPFELVPSKEWSVDEWYKDQKNRTFHKNKGMRIINEGKISGTILGGNLGTFRLLAGTKFAPSLKGAVLFLEECDPDSAMEFDRQFQALLQLEDASNLAGLVFGRLELFEEITASKLDVIIKKKTNLPAIADLDFGHTYPMFTFPIGGKIEGLKITKH